MDEYTYCPGYQFGEALDRPGCLSLVKVLEGDRISYCCRPCFTTSWTPIEDGLWGREPKFVDFGHSDQCKGRQNARISSEPVADREFSVMGGNPDASTRVPPVL